MAPTPSSKSNTSTPFSKFHHHLRTPIPKRLNYTKEPGVVEHPVEVVGRIRNLPDNTKAKGPVVVVPSALQVNADASSVRVRTEVGYRDFSLDGVSSSEEDDIDGFYKKFVESRINGVKLGNKCTVMMYGPTGSGKSHTMFGCPKQPGIVYRSLRDILGDGVDEDGGRMGVGTFVQVTVLEIYNEEIYDLLSTGNVGGGGGGFSPWWAKGGGSASKVRLEVMGKKAKNATFISGNEAGKILKEIQKVEKRRIVKSTLCNERSSRSHCMIILDVPTVGGQLMLVDMAGSENIEQAGQNGFEAKLQTAKINQGNTALKRVVESIANGDSHVPFRDSKLTMLLQDSFEDDKSKILMILCASPDPKELHKTIATLEYGAKAKCIVRGPHTPIKDKGAEDSSSAVILGSRIEALDQFIYKLQMENKLKEKERNEAQKELKNREEEVSVLRAKLALVEGKGMGASEEVINSKVNERTQMLKSELDRKIQECEKMHNEIVEMERRKMEERMFQQQQELEMLRRRLEEMEFELRLSRGGSASVEIEGGNFMRRLMEVSSDESDMVMSMDLDKSYDLGTNVAVPGSTNNFSEGMQSFSNKAFLTTVYEEEEYENEEDDKDNVSDEEVQKEVIEEKKMIVAPEVSIQTPARDVSSSCETRIQNIFMLCGNQRELSHQSNMPVPTANFLSSSVANVENPAIDEPPHVQESRDVLVLDEDKENMRETEMIVAPELSIPTPAKEATSSCETMIQNIFTLCGNQRELSQQSNTLDEPSNVQKSISKDVLVLDVTENKENMGVNDELGKSRISREMANCLNENCTSFDESSGDMEVYVKWEASKENIGQLITKLKVMKDSTLADLRKLIEIHLGQDQQAFTFLVLGDPSGAPVPKEEESATPTTKLPICNNQLRGRLACLRQMKPVQQRPPFSPLENKMATVTPEPRIAKKGEDACLSPAVAPHLSSTPFITVRRY